MLTPSLAPASSPRARADRVVAFCGGVGGAKLALGLQCAIDPDRLTVAVNTGDDFEHLGLSISPDLDTVLYTLAGISDTTRGWGRADETWRFMAAIEEQGGEAWFQLGDRDLALHVERTRRLGAGATLTGVVEELARSFGVRAALLPVSDDPVRTIVHTAAGDLPFQHYFVKTRCAHAVTGISFAGAEAARVNPALLSALAAPGLAAIVICPSNPYLSIDPMLAVPGVRAAIRNAGVPVVAVSPIVGGQAVKGPTAKIMRELGVAVTSRTIARHYAGLIDGMVIDERDGADAARLELPVHVTRTLMESTDDKRQLAHAVLAFATALQSGHTAAQDSMEIAG